MIAALAVRWPPADGMEGAAPPAVGAAAFASFDPALAAFFDPAGGALLDRSLAALFEGARDAPFDPVLAVSVTAPAAPGAVTGGSVVTDGDPGTGGSAAEEFSSEGTCCQSSPGEELSAGAELAPGADPPADGAAASAGGRFSSSRWASMRDPALARGVARATWTGVSTTLARAGAAATVIATASAAGAAAIRIMKFATIGQ
ncbi:MAG TPA: hypothetical protein VND20_01215 [Candidatus Binataceae bacterium]|nr:hypothetical protein [Candidatus Binataceae bacterium]